MSNSDQSQPDLVKPTENDVNYWAQRWEQHKTGWHINDVNPFLVKYVTALTGDCRATLGPVGQGKSVFVPLCGKTKDLAYLRSLGFRVFAIEGVEQAIKELDQEESLGLQLKETDSVYQTEDGNLTIYYGDFFKCPIEKWGPFDCVWDRGSFIAMEYASRRQYIDVMKRSVRKTDGKYINFRYLMETVYYDKTLFDGPPHSVDAKDMIEFYGDWTDYEALQIELVPETSGVRKNVGGADVESMVYLLKPKTGQM